MRRLNFLYLLLLGVFFTACHSDDDTLGDWSKNNEFPGTKRVLAYCFEYNGEAYIGMGYNPEVKTQDKNLRDFWKFNGTEWKRLPDFPVKGRKGAVAFVVGDTAYVGAGFRDKLNSVEIDSFYNDFYKYDLIKNEWVKKAGSTTEYATTSIAASGFNEDDCSFWGGIAFSLNGKGYAGTGNLDGSRESKNIYCYDPATGGWTDANFNGDSRAGAVVFMLNNKAVVCLGKANNSMVRDVCVFDGTKWSGKDEYAPLKNLDGDWNDDYDRIPRSFGVAFTSNLDSGNGSPRGYVAGGEGSYGRIIFEYNIDTDRWREVTEFPAAMNSLRVGAVGFTINQYGYVTTGGSSLSTATDNSTWKFTPGIDRDDNNDY